jgi:hypothetical protein
MTKCKSCRFAIPIKGKYWLPAKEGSLLQKIQIEAYDKKGVICTYDFRIIPHDEANKNIEECELFRRGVEIFG